MVSSSSVRRKLDAAAGSVIALRLDAKPTCRASAFTESASARSYGMLETAFAIQNVTTTVSGHKTMRGASSQSRISTSRLSGFWLAGVGLLKAVAQATDRHDAYAPRLELLAQPMHV